MSSLFCLPSTCASPGRATKSKDALPSVVCVCDRERERECVCVCACESVCRGSERRAALWVSRPAPDTGTEKLHLPAITFSI